LDDFYGAIIFYGTVQVPFSTSLAMNCQTGTTSVLETDGRITPITPMSVSYKARFSDGSLQWIRGSIEAAAYRAFGSGR
jgi:hypothetical protein